ncbi:AGAP001104-PA-like protein [Anopheles sinensis]|uniref:AGAP001104-PA-like protein n=1 Tax=Anopheles sinensis TaxID=74873 RepID=A0A084W099_ANOSI|nr:AGAP001104-PA-like protein [Anopheles sinensis]
METELAAGSSKRPESCSVRKLKQSRLPFQALSPGTTSSAAIIGPSVEVVESRKRKPSSEELELGHASKIGRVLKAKENEKLIEVQDSKNGVHKDHEDLPPDELLTTSQTASRPADNLNNSTKLNNRHKKRHTRNIDNKIFIKLPRGKQKCLTSNKVKSSKKKNNQSETADLHDTSREIILLDDTVSSEDIEPDHTSTIANETIDKEKQTVPLSATLETSNQLNSSSTSDLDKELRNHENEHEIATSANEIVSLDRAENQSGDITLTKLFSKDQSLKNISLDQSDIVGLSRPVSDLNSSDEDIYMLCTPNSKVVPKPDESQKLTPKQIARREEHKKRLAKKLEEKEEKRRKAQEEREEKAREKEEQERQRRREREEKEEHKKKEREEKEELRRREREEKEEQKRKEREEKEDMKRKEREEKEKKRQAEMDLKNEEKRQKEEERRKKEEQKEEERKRKEEEKEAEEKRKQKVAQAFTSFFVKKNASGNGTSRISDEENSFESSLGASTSNTGTLMSQQRFMPFCVKGDMRLAPMTRRVLGPLQKAHLEQSLANEVMKPSSMAPSELYLGLLRDGIYKPRKAGRTWSMEEEEDDNDDIMIVGDTVCHQIEEDPAKMKQKFKAKFFLFEENRRPPFRGTWRKRSSCIGARRPFAQDKKYFDYDVDSDEEWEEEEPGESLHGSDDEKDVDPEEDYEVDNEFFVPHGHLSDEELQAEDEEGGMDDNSPEAQKAKLKIMQQEFVAEMKKKTEKIKPRLIGCIWENPGEKMEENNRSNHVDRHVDCSAIIWKMLNDRAMLYDADEPISFTISSTNANRHVAQELEVSSPGKDTEKGPKKGRITDDAFLKNGNKNEDKPCAENETTSGTNNQPIEID